jgi:hypothetical protein
VVTIRFYDSYIVEATPGARMGPPETTTDQAKQQWDKADGSILQQMRLVVTIDLIDRATGMVTYHGVDNRRVLRAVQSPQLLDRFQVGDVVTITFTRAQAVNIVKGR